ncbi:MAG: hypothetical protein EA404_13285 [Spirochaetaceae bacterium]|nr:MAG: hypothetical protein EA404_13285 [Spirochaetaceae bacterium]
MTHHGRGFGKLLLFGEHAAVYGYPALGLALTDETIVSITPADNQQWDTAQIPPLYKPYLQNVLDALEHELTTMGHRQAIPHIRGRADISSTIPVAHGFGSSASLCVAVAQAALSALEAADGHAGSSAASPEVWALANRLERLFHGRPSGIDTGLALHQGITAFRFDGSDLPQALPLQSGSLIVVAAALPRRASTRELISAIAERMQAGDSRTAAVLAQLGQLASSAIDLLPHTSDAAGISRLGTMADQAHAALARLGLETPQLQRCLQITRECGSAGGKLSGAGGGGAFFALFHNRSRAVDAARELIARQAVDAATIRVLEITNGRSRVIDHGGGSSSDV